MADISHPAEEQLQDLDFCIDSNPPWIHTIILAFQNYILMLGTSVMIPSMLVPLMGGTNNKVVNFFLLKAIAFFKLSMADISHPAEEQLQDLDFCIDSNPPWIHTIILAFQNYILMLGTSVMIPSMLVPLMGGTNVSHEIITVLESKNIVHTIILAFQNYILMLGTSVMIPSMLVPLMGGTNGDKARLIQTILFVAGIKTLLQTLFGTRLPAIVGGSYAFVIPTLTIIGDSSLKQISDSNERFLRTIRAIQGALIVASSVQIILGYSQMWGLFSRFFSPLCMTPVICLVGLGLLERGFPAVGRCVEIGLPMLLTLVGFCMYLKHIKRRDVAVFERFGILLSIAIIWPYSHLLTVAGAYSHVPIKTKYHCRTDRSHLLSSAPWIKFPYPLQWGAPTFDAGHSFTMMAAVIVSLIESTGAYFAASRFAMATPPPAYVLSRGIGWQGIGLLLDGLFGTGTGSTVSVENVGLLGLSRVGSRRVVQVSAGFMIFFSILGKFGALFASIPFPIFAAMYCVLFGLTTSVGISFLQFTNMNMMRNLFITGVSLFLGLSVPRYFSQFWASSGHGPVQTNAVWFNGFLNTIFTSPATVALMVAVVLDNTVDVETSTKERGMPWWSKFRNFKGDGRNEEFYTLPCNLNRFIPPY